MPIRKVYLALLGDGYGHISVLAAYTTEQAAADENPGAFVIDLDLHGDFAEVK